MALSEYYIDPASGNDSTGNGTSGTPWKTVQHALDTITRNATDGDRLNVKAGAADTLGAALSLTTYGTPTSAAPVVIQGYTSTAGDGGIGELNGGGTVGIVSGGKFYVWFADMKLGNCGSADVLDVDYDAQILHCEIYGTSGFGIDPGTTLRCIGCWFHDLTGTYAIDAGNYHQIVGNYFNVATTTGVINTGASSVVAFNVINHATDTSINAINGGNFLLAINNTVYTNTANTGAAFSATLGSCILNNVMEGWSGTGGKGVSTTTTSFLGANAYYNDATKESLSAAKWNYSFAALITLGASPFTSKAGGNFSVSTALKALGWPASFLGSSTSTFIDVGAAQRQEPAGGAVSISPSLGSVGAA